MKKIFFISCVIMSLALLTGCNNKEENEKSEYLAMKSSLIENKKYTKNEDINCDITVNIDRLNTEEVSYSVTLSNPKEDMRDIDAIVVHNYYTEDIFPTIGLFDKSVDLLKDNGEHEEVKLKGVIETSDDIDNLELELKILIKYTNPDGEEKDIYYKVT